MAEKPKELKEPKRLNRSVALGEALGRALDPALKKRGFASRDIITHWAAMAPAPYDKLARPDKLSWPRSARGSEGATLYLRCAPGHELALAHEGQQVAAAINRYFGYVLVGSVRLSLEPFTTGSAPKAEIDRSPSDAVRESVSEAVGGIADDGVREALHRLGLGLAQRKK